MASVIFDNDGIYPSSHSESGEIGNTVTAMVAVSNSGSADTFVRLAMQGGAINRSGGTHRVRAGASGQQITTTAQLYSSAGGKTWNITATLYETNANGEAIRTVGSHPNYSLSIASPYVPPPPPPEPVYQYTLDVPEPPTWSSPEEDDYEDIPWSPPVAVEPPTWASPEEDDYYYYYDEPEPVYQYGGDYGGYSSGYSDYNDPW